MTDDFSLEDIAEGRAFSGGPAPAEIIKPKRPPLKIAVMGSAPSSRLLAPFDDKSWKIYACSPANTGVLRRVDTWFELHAVGILKAPDVWPSHKEYFEWINRQSFAVYMEQANDIVPRALAFPHQAIVAKYGPHFFTSSIAWMLAFVIEEFLEARKTGPAEEEVIGIWGVDMAANGEWETQRPGCHHFMRVAQDLGIQVRLPLESDLHRPPPLYAIGEASPMARKLSIHAQELMQRKLEAQQRFEAARQDLLMLEGALAENGYIARTWV